MLLFARDMWQNNAIKIDFRYETFKIKRLARRLGDRIKRENTI